MDVPIPNYFMELRQTAKQRQRTPLEILNRAADRVSEATGELVEATVATINPGGSTFRHTFYLIVPSLDDYTDPLFYAWHGAGMYPVHFLPAGGKQEGKERTFGSPDEFEQELGTLFESEWVRQRMYAMIELAEKNTRRAERLR
jgi:hypothetical protein